MPGYSFLGVDDDGEVKGLNVTDDLLKNVADIRTDGDIQPQPSMTVEKVPMPEGDIVMVRVEPAIFPPVRHKGRIWIRIGPRKGVANEDDERILMEKRRVNVSSFGFFDTKYDCPTNAGMLFFAKNLRRFIPEAYIQYLRQ